MLMLITTLIMCIGTVSFWITPHFSIYNHFAYTRVYDTNSDVQFHATLCEYSGSIDFIKNYFKNNLPLIHAPCCENFITTMFRAKRWIYDLFVCLVIYRPVNVEKLPAVHEGSWIYPTYPPVAQDERNSKNESRREQKTRVFSLSTRRHGDVGTDLTPIAIDNIQFACPCPCGTPWRQLAVTSHTRSNVFPDRDEHTHTCPSFRPSVRPPARPAPRRQSTCVSAFNTDSPESPVLRISHRIHVRRRVSTGTRSYFY